jgi:serine/threonine-protein phosphatase 2A regulatory subunit B'
MVYNAMKLFMEVNPQLFDDCSHEYTEQQSNIESEKATRKAKWDRLTALAEQMKQNGHSSAPAVRAPGAATAGGRSQTRDQDGDDSQQRMERLRLGDERERRPGNSVR